MGSAVDTAPARKNESAGDRGPDIVGVLNAALKGQVSLETAADALLKATGALGRKSGIYTQKALTRKVRDEEEHLPEIDASGLPSEVLDRLVEQQIDELIDAAALTTRQEVVYRLSFCGLGVRRISATLRICPQSVAAALSSARRKLLATYADGRYAGWYEVYLSEVRRYAYNRRR